MSIPPWQRWGEGNKNGEKKDNEGEHGRKVTEESVGEGAGRGRRTNPSLLETTHKAFSTRQWAERFACPIS